MKLSRKENLVGLYLIIIYTVGVVGLTLPLHQDFVLLTPLNLLVSILIMLWFHDTWNMRSIAVLLFSFVFGFLAEAYGTNYGVLFGNYNYGNVLGTKLWNTPLAAGMLWLIVTYGAGVLLNQLFPKWHFLMKTTIGALLLVLLDTFIEPVAIKLNFWQWQGGAIPLQNYIGWGIVGTIQLAIFHYFMPTQKNNIGILLFVVQYLFFIILNIIL